MRSAAEGKEVRHFEILFELRVSDILRYQVGRLFRRQPLFVGILLLSGVVLPPVLLLQAAQQGKQLSFDLRFLIPWVLLALVFLVFLGAARREVARWKDQLPRRAVLSDDGASVEGADSRTILGWSGVESVVLSRHSLAILGKAYQLILVPRRCLGGEDRVTQILSFLIERVGTERARARQQELAAAASQH